MPKIKSTPSPIQKKIQEICEVLFYIPAPPLVALIEEKLVNQINEDMVKKAHNELLSSRKQFKSPSTSTDAPAQTRKTSTLTYTQSELQE